MYINRSILSLLQLLLLGVILFFTAMTYWSYLVQEETLLRIEKSLDGKLLSPSSPLQKAAFQESSHIHPEAPNLLTPDPFISKALPALRAGKIATGTYSLPSSQGKPENISPFSPFAEVNDWFTLCIGSVARPHVGLYDAFAPDLASKVERIEKEDHVEFWVHLRDGINWQPLEKSFFPSSLTVSDQFLKSYPVEAQDFRFFFDAYSNTQVDAPVAVTLRTVLSSLKDLKVIDSKTFVVTVDKVEYEGQKVIPFDAERLVYGLRPLPRFVYLYYPDGRKISPEEEVRTSSSFAQALSRHFALNVIVSCGPWTFDGFDEEMISFKRNPNYPEPYLANWEKMVCRFYSTPDAIYRDFVSKNADLCYVPRNKLLDFKKLDKKNITSLTFPERAYFYVGLNNSNPILRSKSVRQALDYAVDKERIIQQALNNQGAPCTGPFLPSSDSCDPNIKPRPFSPITAKELLIKDGWTLNSEGIFEKEIDGKRTPCRFSLIYIVGNPTIKQICDLVSLQLKEIGVDCRQRGVEVAEISKAIEEKDFDAYFFGWLLDTPPEQIDQCWSSAQAKLKGSSNAVMFENKEVDRISDALKLESDPEKRIALYHRAHAIIVDETPYLFLYCEVRKLAFWDSIDMVFIPKDRQDLCPGAVDPVPQIYYSWEKNEGKV